MIEFSKIYSSIIKLLLLITILLHIKFTNSFATPSIISDTRIKTFIYTDYDIYKVKFHYKISSYIEFPKGEFITDIAIGDASGWKLIPKSNKLYIKPSIISDSTNLIITTSKKRNYKFDIESSKKRNFKDDSNISYVVKFFYPSKSLFSVQSLEKNNNKHNYRPNNNSQNTEIVTQRTELPLPITNIKAPRPSNLKLPNSKDPNFRRLPNSRNPNYRPNTQANNLRLPNPKDPNFRRLPNSRNPNYRPNTQANNLRLPNPRDPNFRRLPNSRNPNYRPNTQANNLRLPNPRDPNFRRLPNSRNPNYRPNTQANNLRLPNPRDPNFRRLPNSRNPNYRPNTQANNLRLPNPRDPNFRRLPNSRNPNYRPNTQANNPNINNKFWRNMANARKEKNQRNIKIKNSDLVKLLGVTAKGTHVKEILNFDYSFIGNTQAKITPTKVFDDGKSTFLEFDRYVDPSFFIVNVDGSETPVEAIRLADNSFEIPHIAWQFTIRDANNTKIICIFNERLYF